MYFAPLRVGNPVNTGVSCLKVPMHRKPGLDEDEEDAGGIYLEKEDVLLIYHALKNYKPESDDEEMVYELLVEQFEEILIVDYKVKLPGVRW